MVGCYGELRHQLKGVPTNFTHSGETIAGRGIHKGTFIFSSSPNFEQILLIELVPLTRNLYLCDALVVFSYCCVSWLCNAAVFLEKKQVFI